MSALKLTDTTDSWRIEIYRRRYLGWLWLSCWYWSRLYIKAVDRAWIEPVRSQSTVLFWCYKPNVEPNRKRITDMKSQVHKANLKKATLVRTVNQNTNILFWFCSLDIPKPKMSSLMRYTFYDIIIIPSKNVVPMSPLCTRTHARTCAHTHARCKSFAHMLILLLCQTIEWIDKSSSRSHSPTSWHGRISINP